MHGHATMHHHDQTYPVSSCRIEGDALVVQRAGSQSVSLPMKEIRTMTFLVGHPSRGSWHDVVTVSTSTRTVRLTSHGAVPGQVVLSRNAYRKFVLRLVKSVRTRAPRVGLYVYGEGNASNRFLAVLLFVIGVAVGWGGMTVITHDGASAGPLAALACAAGLLYVAATQMRAAPARPIDPEREADRMVPPPDADG